MGEESNFRETDKKRVAIVNSGEQTKAWTIVVLVAVETDLRIALRHRSW